MPRSTAGYTVVISRSHDQLGWVRASLRKQWWTVKKGTSSRAVCEVWFYPDAQTEHALVEDALRELLRMYCDQMQ